MLANGRLQLSRQRIPLALITSDSDWGGVHRGAGLGPRAFLEACRDINVPIAHLPTQRYVAPHLEDEPSVDVDGDMLGVYERTCTELRALHYATLGSADRTLILSGDHSTALGFVSGMRLAYPTARIGLIWVDAHGDIHTPYTTPSGNVHGMPVAAMLGLDNITCGHIELSERDRLTWSRLKDLARTGRPLLSPSDVFYMEIRDLEAAEWQVLSSLGIRHQSAAARREIGIERVLHEMGSWAEQFDYIYASFDVDALDADLVPGTGCPVPDGFDLSEAAQVMTALTALPNLKCLEICEINPLLDHGNRVAEQMAEILAGAWAQLRPLAESQPTVRFHDIESANHEFPSLLAGPEPLPYSPLELTR